MDLEIFNILEISDDDFGHFMDSGGISGRRNFKTRPNYLEALSEIEFYDRFRMTKTNFYNFFEEIRGFIETSNSR